MEEFSTEDLKLLNAFANENDLSMDKDEFDLSLEALEEDSKIGNFQLKAKDVQGAIQNCLQELNKKRTQEANGAALAAQNKDRQGKLSKYTHFLEASSEHLKMKQLYDVEITRLSKLPPITDSNSNDIYDAIKDNLLLVGIDLDEFLPQDEASLDDLESQFGDELNALQGLPKTKRRTVEEVQEYLQKTIQVLNYRIEDELQNGKAFMQKGDRSSASECIKRKRIYQQELEVLESDEFKNFDKNKTNEIFIKTEEIVLKLKIDFEELNRPEPKVEEVQEVIQQETKVVEVKKKIKKNRIKAKRIFAILDNYEASLKKKIEMETTVAKEYLQKKDKNAAALAIERQKIYKDRLENSPRSFMTNLSDSDAPEMYAKLKQFFAVFQLEMDQFDPNSKLLTHEIFIQILDKYEECLKEKIEEDMNAAKEQLAKKDKDRAAQYMQRKKTYESELENIPKEQIKTIPKEELIGVYSNLADHMKKFGIDIEDLNPLNGDNEEEKEDKVAEVSSIPDLTHEIFLEILDKYEEILYKEMEKEVKSAKDCIAQKDKEAASKHLQRKKVLEAEIQSIPKDQLKQAPLDALSGAYERLRSHMKTFNVNIDDLVPSPKPQSKSTKVAEVSESELTHQIFLEILDKYEQHLYKKMEEDVKMAKELLAKKDKEGAAQYIQRKKVFETEVQNIPKEQLKSVPLSDLPSIYDRLKDHMKTFGANIDEFNPIKDFNKAKDVSEIKLNHEIFLQILDAYEESLKAKIEEDVNSAKEFLANKDKESAAKLIQRKKTFESEIQNIPREQLKSVAESDLPMIYDRLKDHMKIFGVDIDELNPLHNLHSTNDDLDALGLNAEDLNDLEVEETKMTSKILLEILDNLEIALNKKIEEITHEAKELLKAKDKEGATELLKKKKEITTEIANIPRDQIKDMNDEDSTNAYEGLKEHLLMNYDIDIEELNPNSPYFQDPKAQSGEEKSTQETKEEKPDKVEKKIENYIEPNSKFLLRSGYGYITFDQSAVVTGDKVSLDSIIQAASVSDGVFALKGTKKYLHLSKNGVRLDSDLKNECKFTFEYPDNENERVGIKSATSKDLCFSIHKSLFTAAHATKNPTIDTTFEVCFVDDILKMVPLESTFLLKTSHDTYLSISKDGLVHRKVDKPTKAEVFEFIIIDNKLAIKSHYLGSMLMIDDDGNFKFTKSMTKKVRFQMHVIRVHKTHKLGFFMLRSNQFLSAKKSTFGKFTIATNSTMTSSEEFELNKLNK